MEQPVLADSTQVPTDKVIISHLGKRHALWVSLFEHIHTEHPDVAEQWRYYNDGKQWLMKVTRKSKTVFWLSLIPGSFRITAYVAVSAQKAVLDSALSDEMKKQFRTGKAFGKIKGITITFRSKRDVEEAKALIGLKNSLR
jgi:hypothetical protein